MTYFRLLSLIAMLLPVWAGAQSSLVLDSIMAGEAYVGRSPEDPYWSPDGNRLFFTWQPPGAEKATLHSADRKGVVREVPLSERRELPSNGGAWDRARSKYLWESGGDLFLTTYPDGKTTRLTATVSAEYAPQFTLDGTAITYLADGQAWRRELRDGTIRQLTDLRKGTEKRPAKPGPQDAFLEQDQLQLFEVLRSRKSKETDASRLRDSLRRGGLPKPFHYAEQRVTNLRIDPSGRFVTFSLVSEAAVKDTDVPDFVTTSGYNRDLPARPKVGHPQDRQQFHCYDTERDTMLVLATDSLPGIRQKPDFLKDYHADSLPFDPLFAQPRPVYFYAPIWSGKGLAAMEIRSQDNKDRWLALYDPATNSVRVMDHQRDEAWIGYFNNTGWLKDEETFWFLSEASGFAQLYAYNVKDGATRRLTQGDWEVLQVRLSQDGKTFFIHANAEGPFEHHFYHLPVTGGALKRITQNSGGHEVMVSPDERLLAVRFSESDRPWELYLMENKPGAGMQRLTHSTLPGFQAYSWRKPEVVRFTANDGARVPARLYRPAEGKANGAAVIFVHGAGYLQNVHHWWSTYYREYMFHNLLCDEGYTVLDIDYRASKGYGRDWRTAIYRHMGGRDLQDQVDGAAYLVDSFGIDADRIGIYGGSYGGFITLMALFQHPGTFACGAALRSVTDWAHYNHGYTSNILNTPAEDSLAYKWSSPIYFAEGLQDPLLILHGMVDVNVQFQDVVRLSQRLIELGKDDWEMAVYPVEDHGFREASSWADEYKRIHRLFRTHLLRED